MKITASDVINGCLTDLERRIADGQIKPGTDTERAYLKLRVEEGLKNLVFFRGVSSEIQVNVQSNPRDPEELIVAMSPQTLQVFKALGLT